MDEIVIESFIQHCDDMMIAEEGVGSKIMNGIKKGIQKLLKLIRKLIQKIKSLKTSPERNQIPEKAYNAYKKVMSEYNNLLKETDNLNLQLESGHKSGKIENSLRSSILGLIDKYDHIKENFKESMDLARSDKADSMITLDINYYNAQADSFYTAASKLDAEVEKMYHEMSVHSYFNLKSTILNMKATVYFSMTTATDDLLSLCS